MTVSASKHVASTPAARRYRRLKQRHRCMCGRRARRDRVKCKRCGEADRVRSRLRYQKLIDRLRELEHDTDTWLKLTAAKQRYMGALATHPHHD